MVSTTVVATEGMVCRRKVSGRSVGTSVRLRSATEGSVGKVSLTDIVTEGSVALVSATEARN